LEARVLNEAGAPLPLGVVDRVGIDLDTRLDNRFMDVRRPEVQAIFRIRSAVLAGGRSHLLSQQFTEVHTPNIIATSSEGGTELFPVQYFEQKAYLSQSPQLYKQMLMATGLDRVFEVAKYFRAESHNTTRHLNESTAFDCEMAFIDSEEDVMRVLERLVQAIWRHVHDTCVPQLAVLGRTLAVPEVPFPRVTYDEARALVAPKGIDVPWGEDLSREAEKVLGDVMAEKGHAFYFITRYPKKAKPFYAHPEGEVSRSFDLAHAGMEVTSGAQRVHDPRMLEENLKAKGLDPAAFEDYLKAFRYGMPPHGGFGLGVERLCMEMLGLDNVREAVLFPRDRTRLRP
ncbi:MAG: aspartate--tRNA(Asn) ligase, partial [bacterium]